MAYESRLPVDGRFGTLTTAAAISDTTLTSDGFAQLPTLTAGATYFPISIYDTATGITEEVWITAHPASSTSVTAVRGREGSTAQAWARTSSWASSPTTRDALINQPRASLPTDAHIGARAFVRDESVSVERTSSGWAQSVKINPADVNAFAGATPATASLAVKVLRVSGTTTAAGLVTVSLPNGAFPTAIQSAIAIVGSGANGNTALLAGLPSASQAQFLIRKTDGTVLASDSVVLHVWAIGY